MYRVYQMSTVTGDAKSCMNARDDFVATLLYKKIIKLDK